MMHQLRNLPLFLKILAFAAVVAVMFAVATGMGVTAALMVGPASGSSEGEPQREAGSPEGAQSRQIDKGENTTVAENTTEGENASDRLSEAQYLSRIRDIQTGAVEASLESNDRLLRYDNLTDDDVEDMKANIDVLEDYSDRAKDLDPPEKYEDQHRAFILAIDELRGANEIAYRLAADPTSVSQADLKGYDGRIDKVTASLQRSNEILGKDYKTTQSARDIS